MFGSTLWLTLATLAGLVLGFAREWLLVHAWGAGLTSDAFLVALFLPEAVRTALAAGLLSNAALPLYQQRLGAARARWLEALAPSMLLLGAGLALLLTLGAGAWTGVVGAGLSETGGELAAEALKILAWCLPGLLLHGLFGVAALTRERYLLTGCGSLLFNLPPVACLLLRGSAVSVEELAWSCVAGSLLMPLSLLPTAWREGWRPWRWPNPGAVGRELATRLGPLLASALASNGLALLERMVASWLGEGVVTWVNLARKLINLPLVALMSLNQILMALMSGRVWDARLALLRVGLQCAVLLTVPAMVGIVTTAPALVALLLPTQAGSERLALLLVWFSAPLAVGAWNAMLARYAYAGGDTRLPLRCELAGNLVNALALLVLPSVLGPAGIAVAALFGLLTTTACLLRRLQLVGEVAWRDQGLLAFCSFCVALLLGDWWRALPSLPLLALGILAGAVLLGALAWRWKPWRA